MPERLSHWSQSVCCREPLGKAAGPGQVLKIKLMSAKPKKDVSVAETGVDHGPISKPPKSEKVCAAAIGMSSSSYLVRGNKKNITHVNR